MRLSQKDKEEFRGRVLAQIPEYGKSDVDLRFAIRDAVCAAYIPENILDLYKKRVLRLETVRLHTNRHGIGLPLQGTAFSLEFPYYNPNTPHDVTLENYLKSLGLYDYHAVAAAVDKYNVFVKKMDEIDEIYARLTERLHSIKTLEQLRVAFPEFEEFFPTPKSKISLPVAVAHAGDLVSDILKLSNKVAT